MFLPPHHENNLQIRIYQTRTHLFLPGSVSGIFVGVVEAHFPECHSFWMTHGHQYVAFIDIRVVFGKVGVATKRPPYHVFSQQAFPQGLLHHHPRVTEVCNAASERWRKAPLVKLSKAAEGPSEAKLSIEHV